MLSFLKSETMNSVDTVEHNFLTVFEKYRLNNCILCDTLRTYILSSFFMSFRWFSCVILCATKLIHLRARLVLYLGYMESVSEWPIPFLVFGMNKGLGMADTWNQIHMSSYPTQMSGLSDFHACNHCCSSPSSCSIFKLVFLFHLPLCMVAIHSSNANALKYGSFSMFFFSTELLRWRQNPTKYKYKLEAKVNLHTKLSRERWRGRAWAETSERQFYLVVGVGRSFKLKTLIFIPNLTKHNSWNQLTRFLIPNPIPHP